MTTTTLMSALLRASQAFNRLVPEAESKKVQGQLLALTVVFYDLAVQVRSGALKVPSDEIEACIAEIEEAVAAAHAAVGKTDAERALAIVEGHEAVALVQGSAQTEHAMMKFAAQPLGWPGERLPRIPPDFPPDFPPWTGPRPWPPRPFPPRPWPQPWPWPPSPPWPLHPWTIGEGDIDVVRQERWR